MVKGISDEKAAGAGAVLSAALASLCCILPVGLGAVGLSAAVAWLDYVLPSVLALCIVIVVYTMIRCRKIRRE